VGTLELSRLDLSSSGGKKRSERRVESGTSLGNEGLLDGGIEG